MTPDCIAVLVPIRTRLGVGQHTSGARSEVRSRTP